MKKIRKLGNGAFANVFLVKLENGTYAALKTPNNTLSKKKAMRYSNSEVAILEHFKKSEYIVNLYSYEITDKTNAIIVELLGDELDTLFNHYKKLNQVIPMPIIKHLLIQILRGLDELATANIIHNDLKLSNILFTKPLPNIFKQSEEAYINNTCLNIQLNPHIKTHIKKYINVLKELLLTFTKVKISDFGNAFSKQMTIDNEKSFKNSRPTRHYISPERLIMAPYWVESDMWSFGCIVYELLTNHILFFPFKDNTMGINSVHLALIVKIFGKFPQELLNQGEKSNKYFIGGKHRYNYLIQKTSLNTNSFGNDPLSYMLYCYGVPEYKIATFVEFLMPIFQLNPKKRISPYNCLESDFLAKY